MSIVIATNIASLQAQRALKSHTLELGVTFERLSSGQRINRASDDPAGLALLTTLERDIRLADVARRNINDGISLLSLTDSALFTITNILQRMAELAEQGANGVYTNRQRSVMDLEVQALASEIERIAHTTEFNTIKLLSASPQVTIQVGFDSQSTSRVILGAVQGTLAAYGLADPNSSQFNHTVLGQSEEEAQENSRMLLTEIRRAIDQTGQMRGEVGANESRLSFSLNNLENTRGILNEGASRIRDADVADEVSKMVRLQILQQAATAVMSHANLQPQIALELLK